jgi:hypothetical protein
MIRIVNIKNTFVFPIFKNGKSSIDRYAKENHSKWLLNEQCRRAQQITIFLRDPRQRFVSGVHSFIEFEKRKNKNLDYDTMLYAIENYDVVNEHFLPQYFWLRKLSNYFNGQLILKTVEELYEFIPNRDAPRIPKITQEQKDKISKIHFENLKYDEVLFREYVGKTLPINELLENIKNALS